MSVRKRKWTTRTGEEREAWIVDYADQSGERHVKHFARKKDAQDFEGVTRQQILTGTSRPALQEQDHC